MDRIRALRNPIRNYDWGSNVALAQWSGRATPSPQPEAELWLGAHPSDPSQVVLDDPDASEPLDTWIARDPAAALGARVAAAFDGELPFLFKVLAPERALSVQAHPDAPRARSGFERENREGVALDHPQRSYRDPRAKPELICALTRFSALCGFRARHEVAARLDLLGIDALAPIAEIVAEQGAAAGFCALLALDSAARRAVADAAVARANESSDPVVSLVAALGAQHPGDIGALAALWLNAVELAPGEALFLGAGQVHAYLKGFGVELMGSSDNTLRAGLTRRHVDVSEFTAALDHRESEPETLVPVRDPEGGVRYPAPTTSFELRRVEIAAGATLGQEPRDGPEIWLCTAGSARIRDESHGSSLALATGAAVWVPASAGHFALEGGGVLHVAGMPR